MTPPLFEVVTPAANAAARRLCTVEAVEAVMEVDEVPDTDAETEAHIDAVSAQMARLAGLAADAAGAIPTFASETLRATWFTDGAWRERRRLLLPWRVPITSITSIVEAGTTLTASVDYRLLPGAVLLRLAGDSETVTCWSAGKIVVTYVAGWASVLSATAPPELSAACAEQCKYRIMARGSDPGLRSYTVNDLRSETFNVPGGDSISKNGLLAQVDAALTPYRHIGV